jgi:cyclic pyranopterin phosphate synthase
MTLSDELVDHEKRHLNYLRMSITDRCNLRCLYCAPEGRIPKLDHATSSATKRSCVW